MLKENLVVVKIGLLIGLLTVVLLAAGCAAGTGEEGLTPDVLETVTATPADAGRALSPVSSPTPSPLPYPAEPTETIEPDASAEPGGGPAGVDGSGSPFGGELIEKEAMVEEIGLALLESFPVQVTVTVRGYLPDGCTTIGRSEQHIDGNTIIVALYTLRPAEAMCTQALVPYEETIVLDVLGLPAGDYIVDVNGVQDGFSLQVDNEPPAQAGECPRGGENEILYSDEDAGFCLLFPGDFIARDDEAPGVVTFYGPPLDQSIEPVQAFLTISIQEPAGGKTADQLAAEAMAEFEGSSIVVTQTPAELGGQAAIILEGLPGRTGSRQILAVHDDTVYRMTVAPYDEAFPQAAGDVARAWELALESFTFID